VEFRVLGPLEVIHDNEASAPSGAKERMILARLLLEPARVVPADALLEAAWPGTDPQAAARSLGVRLANLRAFLEPARPAGAPSTLLVRDGAGYRLVADPEQVDAVRLERLVRDAAGLPPAAALEAYEAALALWRGAPFGDVAYADFAQAEIRRLEELRLRAAEGRARSLVELGRHEEALPELQRLAAAEPLREELARALALALYRGGRQVDALAALRALGTNLVELGLEPSAATRELEQRILVHDRGLAAATAPPPVRRLPLRASRFFGREGHLARAEQLVGDGPLVTIASVGGVGKTRLALELAHRLSSRFPDGSWWCELAPVDSDADVAGTVAEALGGLEQAAGRSGLLLLDNCEHVLDGAAAAVEELLDRCPGIHVVATSRAPLGVDGEQVLRLAGLEVPATDGVSPAVELFVDRAQAAGGMVDLHAIGELCRRLDGLPLAIELAAGRTRSLTPAEIAARLDERFSLLAVSGRRSSARHSTLRAAIGWSYDLLDEPQKRLFERLCVFARGCTLDDAEQVCSGDGIERSAVAGLLDDLVANSLVVASEEGGRTVYGMLETLREYASERLRERGECERYDERHADHYVARARSVLEAGWLEPRLPLVDEFDDLRAAVRWCLHDERPDRAFTLVEALWWPAHARHAEEIASLAEEALARWPGAHALRPRALSAASVARLVSGDTAAARAHAEAAIALEAGVGEPALFARRVLAQLAFLGGDRTEATPVYRELVALSRAAGYDVLAIEAQGFLVQLLHATGERDAALELAGEMRDEAERLESVFMIAWAHYVSGIALLDLHPAAAQRWLESALELSRSADHHHMIRFSLRALGVAAAAQGDEAQSRARLLEALAHDEARSDAASQRTTLLAVAAVLAGRGQLDAAAELLGVAERWPAVPYLAALSARTRELVAGREAALERGRMLDLAGAKALARAEL
jgi:predicted ATPase/DNA-binding SARP family transcriptional activator